LHCSAACRQNPKPHDQKLKYLHLLIYEFFLLIKKLVNPIINQTANSDIQEIIKPREIKAGKEILDKNVIIYRTQKI
jgi:hypothetical protein